MLQPSSSLPADKCSSHASFTSANTSALIWHSRLGHLPMSKLKTLCNLDKDGISAITVCDICAKARQHKLHFPRNKIHSTARFELIHVDLWGPYSVPTYNKQKYFIPIVDDFTRTTWTHLLSSKSSAFDIIKQFLALISTQFHCTVKTVRTDNALELGLSKDATQFFLSKGVIHQTSCPHTPQQNGVVERKHKHLLETSRALLFQSNLPKYFWGDCVLTATYLINRFPSKVLNGCSPYEKLFDTKPSYTNLKPFGCMSYVSTTKPYRDKLSPRAIPCIFLGYPYGKKGYKFLCLDTKAIIHSRDAIFHESTFPYVTPLSAHFIPIPISDNIQSSSVLDNVQPSVDQTQNSSPVFSSNPEQSLPVRKSSRITKLPTYLDDYVHPYHTSNCSTACFCTLTSTCIPSASLYTDSHCNSSDVLSPSYVLPPSEPSSYKEAIKYPEWQKAIDAEFTALEANKTWSLVKLPPGKKPISCKWVFKVKQNSDGTIERYKSRLVIRGYTQKEGADFT